MYSLLCQANTWHPLATLEPMEPNFAMQAQDMDQGDSDFSAVLEAVLKQST